MNWKLIFLLSLFGLAMAVGTVFYISSTIEPLFWLVIFGISAYAIASRASERFFVHGLCLGLVNCVWMTAGHAILFDQYAASHAKEIESMASIPLHPRVVMLIVGPLIGFASGAILGLLTLVIARVVMKKGD